MGSNNTATKRTNVVLKLDRLATHAQNLSNRPKQRNNKSGFKGVCLHKKVCLYKGERWVAQIRSNRQRFYLGHFDTPEEAARAYDAAARRLHGKFAHLNFPEEVKNEAAAR